MVNPFYKIVFTLGDPAANLDTDCLTSFKGLLFLSDEQVFW
jgi:hypothetical protein